MAVKLLHTYLGRLTGELPIPAGVYPDGDPALFDLAAYLVGHQLAEYVDDSLLDQPAPEIVESGEPLTDDKPQDYEFKGRTLTAEVPPNPAKPRAPRGRK